ncbi:MAG TPA: carbon-nitrogen hydrolase family protein [Candidatus Woesearchaeota archaeon]|nr:carbon-nitrogen hydrolase family protein [Candidatus Woesearchaeota archaeon]
MKFRIAAVQFRINRNSIEKNLKKMEGFLKNASGKADVIVFPECFLTGGLSMEECLKNADSKGRLRKAFQNLALKYNIDIVAGSIIEEKNQEFFNACYYVESSGKLLGRYKKINLWLSERGKLSPGSQACVFNTKFGRAGLALCWDLMFPELFLKMRKKGVEIVYCPSLWFSGKKFPAHKRHNQNAAYEYVNSLCKARALENNFILVYANAVGKVNLSDGSQDECIGRTQIIAPIRMVLGKLGDKEEMLIEEIDTEILKEAEKAYGLGLNFKDKN